MLSLPIPLGFAPRSVTEPKWADQMQVSGFRTMGRAAHDDSLARRAGLANVTALTCVELSTERGQGITLHWDRIHHS